MNNEIRIQVIKLNDKEVTIQLVIGEEVSDWRMMAGDELLIPLSIV